MEVAYYGCGDKHPGPDGALPDCSKAPSGSTKPFVMADLEHMKEMLLVIPPTSLDLVDFRVALVKGTATHIAIKTADAQVGSLWTLYEGARPKGCSAGSLKSRVELYWE